MWRMTMVDHLEAAIEFLHQLAGAVDHLEDVDALLVAADLVGQACAAPVLGLVDLCRAAARRLPRSASCSFGDLLLRSRRAGGCRRARTVDLPLLLLHGRVDRVRDLRSATSPRPPTWWQGTCDRRSAIPVVCRIAAVERVHHRLDPRRDEHLRRIGRARRHALDVRRFVRLEPRRARDPRDRAGRRRARRRPAAAGTPASPRCAMIDFSPLCPPADPRGRARSLPERQLHLVDDDEQVGGVDLEEPRQRADRLAAQVHERQRLGQQHRARPAAATSRSAPRAARRLEAGTAPRRASSSTTSKPTLCRVPAYCGPGLPSPTIGFTPTSSSSSFFLSSFFVVLLRLVLVLLALLDDFGLGGAGGRRRGVGRRGDFFGLRHDDVDEHQVGVADRLPLRVGREVADADALVQHQLGDVDVDVLGNVGRQALRSRSRGGRTRGCRPAASRPSARP